LPERVHFLGERPDAHVVVVDLLADHAHVIGQVVDDQLGIGECLAIDLGLLVEARVDGLQRLGQRAEQRLQQLRLLLEHAQVGHQLLVLFVRGRRGRRGARRERQDENADGKSLSHNAHFAVMTKCARRFLANADSS
jgi:hypothetical protein